MIERNPYEKNAANRNPTRLLAFLLLKAMSSKSGDLSWVFAISRSDGPMNKFCRCDVIMASALFVGLKRG